MKWAIPLSFLAKDTIASSSLFGSVHRDPACFVGFSNTLITPGRQGGGFYPQFSHIVLMSAPADVIQERLASRTDTHYRKRRDELAEVLHHLEWVEPLLRRSATHEIVTTMPLDRVVATVLSLAQASD